MPMGGNSRQPPDLVAALVGVQGLKGEAEQLEVINKLAEAKATLMKAMETLISIRPSLTSDSDKACVDGVLRGLVEDGERVQLLLRLDRLSHAWEEEKASKGSDRSTSEPQIPSTGQKNESVGDEHGSLVDLMPSPPSDFKAAENDEEERPPSVGEREEVPPSDEPSASRVPDQQVEFAGRQDGVAETVDEGREEADEIVEGNGDPGSVESPPKDTPADEKAVDQSVADESVLSVPKGTISFELSESDEGKDMISEDLESSVFPKAGTNGRVSDISSSALVDEAGSVVSYSSDTMPIIMRPSGAPRQGGSRFTVEACPEGGIELSAISYLKIGNRPCAEVATSVQTRREFLAPLSRDPAGPADVLVVMENPTRSFLLRGAFEYFDQARVVDVSPRVLPYDMRTTVKITVLNLDGRSVVGAEVRLADELVPSEIVAVTGRSVPEGDPPCTEVTLSIPPIEEQQRQGADVSISIIGRAGNVAEGTYCVRLYRPMVFEPVVKGSRVKLEEDGTVAVRKTGINNAMVFGKYPIKRLPRSVRLPSGGVYYSITVTRAATAMKTFALGLTTIDPSKSTASSSPRAAANLPSLHVEEDAMATLAPNAGESAVGFCSLLVGYDPVRLWVNGRTHKISSRQWRPAREVSVGDSVGLLFSFDRVAVYQNGVLRVEVQLGDDEASLLRGHMASDWWAVLDVLGKVSGVRLNGEDQEPPE